MKGSRRTYEPAAALPSHRDPEAPIPERSPTAGLISSVHGRIRRVLVTIPYWVLRYGDQAEIGPYERAYAAVLTRLPADVERVVACHAEVAATVREWTDGLGIGSKTRIVSVPDDLRFTVWAQDACLVQSIRDRFRFLAPSTFPRLDDASVLALVAEELGLELVTTDLVFQGGNVLVGDTFWLLGADAVLQTLRAELHDGEMPAIRTFAEALDPVRRLVLIGSDRAIPGNTSRTTGGSASGGGPAWEELIHTGNRTGTRQPLFDLDTFISLAGRGPDGRYRLLVGDPGLAARLTGSTLPDHALPDVFDDVAAQLAGLGFDVRRNPLPLVHHDDPVLRRRRWYFASSNNLLVEIDGEDRRVWLPTYTDDDYPELHATDQRNAEIWSELGFAVEPLPTFHAFARGLGAVHCICKCLARGEETTDPTRSRTPPG
jgi:hypothetical protein